MIAISVYYTNLLVSYDFATVLDLAAFLVLLKSFHTYE